MSWFDDPAKYYGAVDESIALSQGDIIVAPTAIIGHGTADASVVAPTEIGQERLVSLWLGKPKTQRQAPSLRANVRWGLAMVLPHSCALEKDWNERVQELVKGGHSQEEAEGIANADDTLDPYVALAPLLTYDMIPASKLAASKNGTRLGGFPVVKSQVIPEAYVDFARITTVTSAVASINYRVAQLTPLALGYLKHSIATYFALRSKSRYDELSKAIGRTIVEILPLDSPSGKLKVSVVLDDGTQLSLEGDSRPTPTGKAPERKPR